MRDHNYYVYILTNKNKTVLYTGVTNDLQERLSQHEEGEIKGFTKRYNCHHLLHYEWFNDIDIAIEREKEIKGWKRNKKEGLINSVNPSWKFLNKEMSS